MKIGLWGYGKMGRAIDAIIQSQPMAEGSSQMEVVWRVDVHAAALISDADICKADVVIEFTQPEVAVANLKKLIALNRNIVCGTTGWYDQADEIRQLVTRAETGFISATNFSIGVNLFFALSRQLAGWMKQQPQYAAAIQEIHHIHKKDAPSGTAITLAEGILTQHPAYQQWSMDPAAEKPFLPIESVRTDEVPGTHRIQWKGSEDQIELIHIAHNRMGFAQGAVAAAQWLYQKKGIYTMQDVLNLPF